MSISVDYLLLGVLVVALLLVFIYRRAIRPMKSVLRGMELLREQDFASSLRPVGQKETDKVVRMFNDMMTMLRQERLLVREQNEFLDLLVKESPIGVVILDVSWRIVSANPCARQMLGCAEPDGKYLEEICSPLAEGAARLQIGQSEVVRLPGGHDVYRCSRYGFMNHGYRQPFVLIERLTEEIREAERQAYTRVIRTMAHEVNNSMAAVKCTLDSVLTMAQREQVMTEAEDALRACIERTDSTAAFIRSFADMVKVPEPQLQQSSFGEVVAASLPLLQALCERNGASLEVDLADSRPLMLDPVLMQQVLVNVVKNAAESGSHVTITARGSELEVADDGPGLTPEAEANIFRDVYTSKPGGQGIGLMLVAEILTKHHFRFSIATDGLTRFKIASGRGGGDMMARP